MKIFKLALLLIILLTTLPSLSSSELVTVNLAVTGAFGRLDSVSSDNYRNEFISSIDYALGENEKKLNSCGYKIATESLYYNDTDLISAYNVAKKISSGKPWVILGPLKSNQLIAFKKGASDTTIISTMAESDFAKNVMPPIFSMSHGIDEIASAAANFTAKNNFGDKYGSVIDSSCPECEDFETHYEQHASKNQKNKFKVKVLGQSPSLNDLILKINEFKIDFLLVPNYSLLSGYIIKNIHSKFPNLKFIGGYGWGQTRWSYLGAFKIPSDVTGFSFRRGGRSDEMEKLYDIHSLDKNVQDQITPPPHLTYYTIEAIRILANDLCLSKAHSQTEFFNYMSGLNPNHFETKSKLNIYELKAGVLQPSNNPTF